MTMVKMSFTAHLFGALIVFVSLRLPSPRGAHWAAVTTTWCLNLWPGRRLGRGGRRRRRPRRDPPSQLRRRWRSPPPPPASSPPRSPSTLNNNKQRDSAVPHIIISPSSETTGHYKGEEHGAQTREENMLLCLQSLNCSNELLELVEKFLSWNPPGESVWRLCCMHDVWMWYCHNIVQYRQ